MHQVAALQVVDEEIAVVAKAQRLQDALGLGQRGGVVAAGRGEVRDGMRRQLDVVLEFGLLARQVGLLDGGVLRVRQRDRLLPHERRDGAQGHDQRDDRQENKFLA